MQNLTLLKDLKKNNRQQIMNNSPFKSVIANAMFDYTAQSNNQITFTAGDTLMVTDRSHPEWWVGYVNNKSNKVGDFPASYVKLKSDDNALKLQLLLQFPRMVLKIYCFDHNIELNTFHTAGTYKEHNSKQKLSQQILTYYKNSIKQKSITKKWKKLVSNRFLFNSAKEKLRILWWAKKSIQGVKNKNSDGFTNLKKQCDSYELEYASNATEIDLINKLLQAKKINNLQINVSANNLESSLEHIEEQIGITNKQIKEIKEIEDILTHLTKDLVQSGENI